jgi:hypothetical protein
MVGGSVTPQTTRHTPGKENNPTQPNKEGNTMTKPAPTQAATSLQKIKRETAIITIQGTSSLIVHSWTLKAKKQMLDAQQGRKKQKQLRDPEADFIGSRYMFEDGTGDGFPTVAFKSAVVKGGGRIFGKAVKMTELRQNLLFVSDGITEAGMEITRLIADEPRCREDMVRIGPGAADLRYRAEYRTWSAELRIDFMPELIDLGSIVALVDAGGTCGVGEWRPEKNGTHGMFEVLSEDLA